MQLAVLFVLLGAAWLVQMVLAYLQAQRFMRRVRVLRASGQVAVGRGGTLVRGRAFVALAAAPDGTVTAAEALRGLTVLASPRPHPALVGRTVAELAAGAELPGVAVPVRSAAQQAATTLRNQSRTTAQRTRREPAPAARQPDRQPRPAAGEVGDPHAAPQHNPRPTREGDRCPQAT